MRFYSALVCSGLVLTGLAVFSQNFRNSSIQLSQANSSGLIVAEASSQPDVTPHRGSGR